MGSTENLVLNKGKRIPMGSRSRYEIRDEIDWDADWMDSGGRTATGE